MTSVRESVRRRLEGIHKDRSGVAGDDPGVATLSYRIDWLRRASEWDDDRRREVGRAVVSATQAPGFDRQSRSREYRVPKLDGLSHSGASLVALLEVLDALTASESEGRAP